MLFLGHFSFTYETRLGTRRKQPWHGHFTAAAEARDVDAALEKFAALIHGRNRDRSPRHRRAGRSSRQEQCFCCVSSVARRGEVHAAGRVHRPGEPAGRRQPRRCFHDAAADAEKHAVSYHLEPESEEEDGSYEPWPFVVFEKKPRKKRKGFAR